MMTVGELKERMRPLLKQSDETNILTADEFAQKNGYSSSGIRVVLSRGKISKAIKVGNEWFIPEDACVYGRQYKKKRTPKIIGCDTFGT